MDNATGPKAVDALSLTAEVVTAFVSNNSVAADKLPTLLQEVHDALRALAKGVPASRGNQQPAVPVKQSITPDYIICLEDGKRLKMLKRYLRTHYGLSPEDYRRKWGLSDDYPMVAPSYGKQRSALAKKFGLGTARTGARKSNRGKAPSKRRHSSRFAA